MATVENTDQQNDNAPLEGKQPQSNERVPGQGNSKDGLTRRLGADVDSRGVKEQEKMEEGEGNGEEERPREGSQGASKGQKSDI